MNLDELQSIRDRERQSDSLQQLRESFYADVGEFVSQLREERETAAERADDPFDAPEVNRLSDDIKTAEQTVEAIYERRVGKLVKMASFAAADMPTEDEGLTAEERDLFEQLVASIEQNRSQVFGILDGEEPTSAGSEKTVETPDQPAAETPAEPATDGVDAADLMGSGDDTGAKRAPPDHSKEATPEPDESPPAPTGVETTADSESPTEIPPADPPTQSPDGGTTPGGTPAGGTSQAATGTSASENETQSATAETPQRAADGEGVDRTTVRITRDVGEILGVDEREYDLAAEDVVTLPATNADPLVDRDAAERLD